MQHKHLLLDLIEKFFPDGSVGVEIGVDKADTTVYLLENCSNLRHLYAIDHYPNRDGRYNQVVRLLSSHNNCTLLRNNSNEAATLIPDNLDFVFVDGDHSYDGVLSDLINYVPKIKSGGLVTGHDWTRGRRHFGIVQACEKYLTENENLFQPLYGNDALKNMGLGDFGRGGWHAGVRRHLIHKKYPSAYPLWWVVKA